MSRDATIRIWDPIARANRHTLTGHYSDVTALATSPNGTTWLASASRDATVRIWNPGATHRRLRTALTKRGRR